jgi:hypothetical protein
MYLKKNWVRYSFYIFRIDTFEWWQGTVVIVVMASSQSLEKVTICICNVPDSTAVGILQLWLQDLKELLVVKCTTWNRITSLQPLWGIWSTWHWGHVKISAGRQLSAELSTKVTSGRTEMPQICEQHSFVWYVTHMFLYT